jgi:lipopolysaccharide/colanic/teichoic acid biosynthesis glycosyltransferase
MQSLVETGFVGFGILLLMFGFLFQVGSHTKNRLLILFNLILFLAFFTESYLSRQIGIISFLGFNSLFLNLAPFDFDKNLKAKLKKGFDLLFSSLVLVFLLSWLLPVMGLLIYIDTKSFPLFVQNRVGKDGRVFRCFKMRTMVQNADADVLPAKEGDNRITRFGQFLRKYAIDELPQFFNVFLGQMSVVGPRPLMVKEEENWNSKVEGFTDRLTLKPGVTGLAQANGYKGIIHHRADLIIRFRLDKLYLKKQSLWIDVKIIVRTILFIFT